jgi:hypothetical protein
MEGRLTPGSGNKWYAKSDVRTSTFVISCKQTDNDSFSITRGDFREIQKIAFQDGKDMALAIDMNGIRFAVVEWNMFANLVNALNGIE